MTPGLATSVVAYQIVQDWVREGEAQRSSSSVRGAHAGADEGRTARRLAHGLVHGIPVLGRLFHMAPREVRQELGGPRVATRAR